MKLWKIPTNLVNYDVILSDIRRISWFGPANFAVSVS